jgi:hypothetical protein
MSKERLFVILPLFNSFLRFPLSFCPESLAVSRVTFTRLVIIGLDGVLCVEDNDPDLASFDRDFGIFGDFDLSRTLFLEYSIDDERDLELDVELDDDPDLDRDLDRE